MDEDDWAECGAEHQRYLARCTQPVGHDGPHLDVDAYIQWKDAD